MQHFDYVPHPWVAQRAHHKPPQTADEHIGFNGQLAARITKAVGTMWAVYLALGIQILWMTLATVGFWVFGKDPYPFAFLLFLSNIIQLLLMFVILVGQQVLGAASDKRAVQTYKDAEAILQECLKLQEHLMEQDKVLARILDAWPQPKGA
jgi:uncharacterized membrane protein